MQSREKAHSARSDRERNEELIGVLTAISIVSKRLAKRLTALERARTERTKGVRDNDFRQSSAIRK